VTSSPKPGGPNTWVSGLEALGPDEEESPRAHELRIGPYTLIEKGRRVNR
jgi:hypothetical protein